MANQYGVDVGNTLLKATQIKKAQEEQKAQSFKNEQNNALLNYAQNPEDEQATKQMLLFNPELMKQTADAIGKMDENERKRAQDIALRLARIGAQVLESDDSAKTWEELKSGAPEQLQKQMGEYDPVKAKQLYFNGLSTAELTKNPDVVTFGGKDQMYRNGLMTGETTSSNVLSDRAGIEKERIKQSGENGLKTGDESLIARQVAQDFGGNYNPVTNEFIGLSAGDAKMARDISARASRIYANNNGKMTRLEAVQKAFQEQKGTQGQNKKTLGISWQK